MVIYWCICIILFVFGYVFCILYFVVYREFGENMIDEELCVMIDEFDRDGDGESKCL